MQNTELNGLNGQTMTRPAEQSDLGGPDVVGFGLTIKDPSWNRLSICAGLVAAAIKLAIFGEVQMVFRKAAEVSRDHEG